jgi:hypothetical protein
MHEDVGCSREGKLPATLASADLSRAGLGIERRARIAREKDGRIIAFDRAISRDVEHPVLKT